MSVTPEFMGLMAIYGTCLAVLSLPSLHRLWLSRRGALVPIRSDVRLETPTSPVLVQLPVYNEPEVVERAIDAVCRLDYPRHLLRIQVLDDSTDSTSQKAAARVASWREAGVQVDHIRRAHRQGFKAGALAEGLRVSDEPLVAVFDADFCPREDFLLRLLPSLQDPHVGMVQARWGHLNRTRSPLTQAQAVLLDGHFINEHGGRFASNLFFNFNGTAGIWRRTCIEDAGGWSGDTLTEDLDLSYRAQLRGWAFVFRPDVVAAAELPEGVDAFKAQQHRWARGSIQTARKILPTLWRRTDVALSVKLEAGAHLLANVVYPLVVLVALLMPAVVLARPHGFILPLQLLDLALLGGATVSLVWAYRAAQARIGRTGFGVYPVTLAIGAGLAINATWAVVMGLVGPVGVFNRTPKSGTKVSRSRAARGRAWQAVLEVLLAAYLIAGAVLALVSWRLLAVPFLLLLAFGFGYLGLGSLWEMRPSWSWRARGGRLVSAHPRRI